MPITYPSAWNYGAKWGASGADPGLRFEAWADCLAWHWNKEEVWCFWFFLKGGGRERGRGAVKRRRPPPPTTLEYVYIPPGLWSSGSISPPPPPSPVCVTLALTLVVVLVVVVVLTVVVRSLYDSPIATVFCSCKTVLLNCSFFGCGPKLKT